MAPTAWRPAAAAAVGERSEKLPAPALEFLALLGRVEATVHEGCPEDEGDVECDEDVKLWKAKVRSYEASLRARLEAWQPAEVLAERLRKRIEDIGPALELAIGEKRKASAPFPEPVPEPALRCATGAAQVSSSLLLPTTAAVAMALPMALAAPASLPGEKQSELEMASVPWRPSTLRGSRPSAPGVKGAKAAARGQIEDEMVDLAEGMKGAANSFLKTLKADNQRLDDMSESQQKSLDRVTAETQKGQKLMRSGQLGFFCTMLMVAVSVVIFFMMLPFIFFT